MCKERVVVGYAVLAIQACVALSLCLGCGQEREPRLGEALPRASNTALPVDASVAPPADDTKTPSSGLPLVRPTASIPTSAGPSRSLRLQVKQTSWLVEDGGRVDWSRSVNLLAFDRPGPDGYYDVWVMNPDGDNQECLSCDQPIVSQGHCGNPGWHPSGKWIVFQAANSALAPAFLDRLVRAKSSPGAGWLNNLWVTDAGGTSYYQLTDVGKQGGVLHPHFSHDGTRLLWAERLGPGDPARKQSDGYLGEWALKVANFVEGSGGPRLEATMTLKPGPRPGFYESHGFSRDDTRIIFTANCDEQEELGFDIYSLDLASQELERLTHTPSDWDEHAIYSPDGQRIVWMSSLGIPAVDLKQVKTDFWLMRPDGSGQQRLTFWNDPQSAEKLAIEGGVVAADCSWSPDGTRLVAYIITDRTDRVGSIMMIDLGE